MPSTGRERMVPKVVALTLEGVRRVSFGFKPERVLSLCWVSTLTCAKAGRDRLPKSKPKTAAVVKARLAPRKGLGMKKTEFFVMAGSGSSEGQACLVQSGCRRRVGDRGRFVALSTTYIRSRGAVCATVFTLCRAASVCGVGIGKQCHPTGYPRRSSP